MLHSRTGAFILVPSHSNPTVVHGFSCCGKKWAAAVCHDKPGIRSTRTQSTPPSPSPPRFSRPLVSSTHGNFDGLLRSRSPSVCFEPSSHHDSGLRRWRKPHVHVLSRETSAGLARSLTCAVRPTLALPSVSQLSLIFQATEKPDALFYTQSTAGRAWKTSAMDLNGHSGLTP
ncbi:hypothetical protein IWX49DRAFT_267110 [Phyllosticta citricarpa]|uniref:Uncharacterized protein n=1 Tax=Phyllosticta citricarpa TaxID=55181 RepID=A0ABR1LK12_9PEZI